MPTNHRLRRAFGEIDHSFPLRLRDRFQTMTAEDMAVILNHVPGSFIFVGAANAARGFNYPRHHPRFDINEDAADWRGAAVYCRRRSVLPVTE